MIIGFISLIFQSSKLDNISTKNVYKIGDKIKYTLPFEDSNIKEAAIINIILDKGLTWFELDNDDRIRPYQILMKR